MVKNKLNMPLIISIVNSLYLPELEQIRYKLNGRIKYLKERQKILNYKKQKFNKKK